MGPIELVMHTAMAAFGRLPESVVEKLAGDPVKIDGQTLHPMVKLALKALNAGGPTFETKPLVQGRAELDSESAIFGTEPELDEVTDFLIPGEVGRINARYYRAGSKAKARRDGLVVYLHGGGFVLGGLPSADAFCRGFALETGLQVISLDYRLAPENPFPAAVNDCVAAFKWVQDNAEKYGTTRDRIGIGGESAGGNLTCVVAQELVNTDRAPLVAFPISPVTDLSQRRPSYDHFYEGFFLTVPQLDWYYERYLSDPEDAKDPRVSPLLAGEDRLRGLCPHVVTYTGFDPLRDEIREYVAKLKNHDVEVEEIFFEGLIHGFNNATALGNVVVGRNARIANAVAERFDRN